MKIMAIVGARPQFIKFAPISRLLRSGKFSGVKEVLVHTGQHFDKNMSESFFEELDIPKPDYNLNVHGLTHGRMTGRMLERIEGIIEKEVPDWVVVFGDTNSTIAGALAAAKMNIPVAHVEAGARSFNLRMPEEINRIVTDNISTLLFCSSDLCVEMLRREGFLNIVNDGHWICADSPPALYSKISKGRAVINVGDVMYDSLLYFEAKANDRLRIMKDYSLVPGEYILATIHRSENTDDPEVLINIMKGLCDLAREIAVVMPLHPRLRKSLELFGFWEYLERAEGLLLLDPLPYIEFVCMERHARGIVTDSGGVQKEAYFLGVPCFTLRNETEWEETVDSGWNMLLGNQPSEIRKAVLNTERPVRKEQASFGDGRAAETILKVITA